MYRRKEVLDAIRTAAEELGEPLTLNGYIEWAEERDGRPTGPVIYAERWEWEDWPGACAAAGVRNRGKGRDPMFDEDDVLEAIQAAAAERGEPLAMRDYDDWARGNGNGRPSSKVVGRLGTWSDLCERAGVETPYDV